MNPGRCGALAAGLGMLLLCTSARPTAGSTQRAPDPDARAMSVSELRALASRGESGAAGLAAALTDAQPAMRAAAVQLLADAKGRRAIPLIAPMTADTDDGVVVAAVNALLEFGGEGTLDPVRRAFASASPRVRSQTAAYVGDARDTRFLGDLGALLSDETPSIRRSALEALRATGDPGTFPFLMAATGDGDGGIAASAIAGLEFQKEVRALPRIAQLASSADASIRAAAAHAIAALGGARRFGPAFNRLVVDEQRSVRLAAVSGLRDAPSADAAVALARLSEDPDPVVRRGAAQAWRAQALPGASAALSALATDVDENVRATAVLALGFLHATEHADGVVALATDASQSVREAVAATLGDLGRPRDLETLGTLAADASPEVRATAVVAAARIGTDAALAVVALGAEDPDPLVRLETVRAYGQLGIPQSLDQLRSMAAAGELAIRIAAIDQLGARKDRGARPLLLKLAQDPVESLRVAARKALEAIGA